jgi:hypothetical protein
MSRNNFCEFHSNPRAKRKRTVLLCKAEFKRKTARLFSVGKNLNSFRNLRNTVFGIKRVIFALQAF